MRGKVKNSKGRPLALGITPAYAGKSDLLHLNVQAGEDHPRVCGEK